MSGSTELNELINVADTCQAAGFAEPCILWLECAKPVDLSDDHWQWATNKLPASSLLRQTVK